jgi:AmmeMemoRadiSam system protein A
VAILSEKKPAELPRSGASQTGHSLGPTLSHFADLPALARLSIEAQLEGGDDEPPVKAAGALMESRGVFVTLRTVSTRLRGCAGTASPTATNLVHETWHCARAAAFADARFPALQKEELRRVRVAISILSPLEPVTSLSELDPVQYGIQVTADDGHTGLLLPALAGVDTVAEQVRLARHKGGIAETEHVRIQRFTTRVYQEPPPASDERG